jgi:hypothetical protein
MQTKQLVSGGWSAVAFSLSLGGRFSPKISNKKTVRAEN